MWASLDVLCHWRQWLTCQHISGLASCGIPRRHNLGDQRNGKYRLTSLAQKEDVACHFMSILGRGQAHEPQQVGTDIDQHRGYRSATDWQEINQPEQVIMTSRQRSRRPSTSITCIPNTCDTARITCQYSLQRTQRRPQVLARSSIPQNRKNAPHLSSQHYF